MESVFFFGIMCGIMITYFFKFIRYVYRDEYKLRTIKSLSKQLDDLINLKKYLKNITCTEYFYGKIYKEIEYEIDSVKNKLYNKLGEEAFNKELNKVE